jgi:hypothetical protein
VPSSRGTKSRVRKEIGIESQDCAFDGSEMAAIARQHCISSVTLQLRQHQIVSGGWPYFASSQESIEATCLSALALSPERDWLTARAVDFCSNLN